MQNVKKGLKYLEIAQKMKNPNCTDDLMEKIRFRHRTYIADQQYELDLRWESMLAYIRMYEQEKSKLMNNNGEDSKEQDSMIKYKINNQEMLDFHKKAGYIIKNEDDIVRMKGKDWLKRTCDHGEFFEVVQHEMRPDFDWKTSEIKQRRICGNSSCDKILLRSETYCCKRCRQGYCSKRCQKAEWNLGDHKTVCDRINHQFYKKYSNGRVAWTYDR